jgi:hypothetical protein
MGRKVIDIVCKRFGKLVVVKFLGSNLVHGSYWLCFCLCGVWVTAYGSALKSGGVRSCGCLRKDGLNKGNTTHKSSYTPEYHVWACMVQRCTNKKASGWSKYGARGITVCDRWLKFSNFIEDMGFRPDKNYSIERINNTLGYFPLNCKWATVQEQVRNKKSSINIEHAGEILCLKDWLRVVKVSNTKFTRLRRELGLEGAIQFVKQTIFF